jgi:trans-2,3-dihydro-3-hydroxyanthranilate isomerase
MQRAAREMNLSETVFVFRAEDPNAHLRVRIFTPTTELPFAGHPVLGTAFVVGRAMGSNVVRLETGLGVIPVTLSRPDGGAPYYGEMEQLVPAAEPFEAVDELFAALGAAPDAGALPIEAYRNGPLHVYVEFPSEDAVASLRPDIGALERLGDEYGINCFAGSGDRWKTRMFGPALGVAEDPATGSAAGPLALHLARHGRVPIGSEIEIVQGVEIGRRSVLRARTEGVDRVERVFVGGSAVIVARGEYRLD